VRSRWLLALVATVVCWLLAAPAAGAATQAGSPRADGTTQVGIVVKAAPPDSGGATAPPTTGGNGAGGLGVSTPPDLAVTGPRIAQLLAASLALLVVGMMLTTAVPARPRSERRDPERTD
jgi:hypothetical protein